MTRLAVYATAQGLDGRDAALAATQKALDQLGALKPVLGIGFVSEDFSTPEALAGISSLLGDAPLWGISTVQPLAGGVELPRSVTVAIVAGNDLKAQANWYPTYYEDSLETGRQALRALRQELLLPQGVLAAMDGVNGNAGAVCAALADLPAGVAGCLASGGYQSGKTWLFARGQSGPGGLAIASLGGRFRLSSGVAHGWRDLGLHFTVTRARDVWIQALDDRPPAEAYARYLGRTPREWAYAPLTDLVRLYPLGLETGAGDGGLLPRSPLRVEVDGSLRMSAPVPEGAQVRLMLGDPEACLQAVESAVGQALAGLGSARPLLALAFVDLAWRMLFESRPGQLAAALSEALGSIPLAGGYTLGQVARGAPTEAPQVYNQSLVVALIAAAE